MIGPGRLLGWLVVALLAVSLVGCGATAPGADGSRRPGSSPAPSLDVTALAVCDATVMMESGLARVRAVKLRRGARNRLDGAVQSVLTGQDALLNRAPYTMRTRLRTLGLAVINLQLATEDFWTTDRLDIAATNVRKATTQLGKALEAFQRWVGCDSLVLPSPPPDASPDTSPDASGEPDPSVGGPVEG